MFHIPEDGPYHPMVFYKRLIKLPEHAHLAEGQPDVAFLMREEPEMIGGRVILGTCSIPAVNGRHRKLFSWMLERILGYEPVFLFTFDAQWWADATDLEREILTYHEMCHAIQAVDKDGCPRINNMTGEPVWAIKNHDVEEFSSVVRRYGPWSQDVKEFIDAAQMWNTKKPNREEVKPSHGDGAA